MEPTSPPRYSSSSPSPSYTEEPSSTECRYVLAARLMPSVPQGIYTKITRGLTLKLYNQEPDTELPTYVRNAVIRGSVQISEEEVELVIAKLEGKQTLSTENGGKIKHNMFSLTHTLWRQQDDAICPSTLDLSVSFPPNYMDRQGIHDVPPTFEASFEDRPSLHICIEYVLSVTATKTRFGSWKQNHSVFVPLKYRPRSRPYLPITPNPYPFLDTVKTTPEEWYEITSIIPSEQDSVGTVDALLFIPAVRIYALTDTIPFHLQLKGPMSSLRELTHTTTPLSPQISGSSATSSLLSSIHIRSPHAALPYRLSLPSLGSSNKTPLVGVYLLRQIIVAIDGKNYWRNLVIGEGKLSSVDEPPQWPLFEARDEALNWEGEIMCNEDVQVASFTAGDIHVRDFIVVHVCPSHPERSMFKEHKHSHPIRFVTDTYRDVFRHPSDL